MKWFGRTQFALFRIIFGCYLTIHFVSLIPYGTEMFSDEGMLKDSTLLLGYGKVPNILFVYDSPIQIVAFLVSLTVASILLTIGIWRRRCAVWLFYGWVSLLNRNHFIANPSLSYIGWLLLCCILVETGDRLGFLLNDYHKKQEEKHNKRRWEVSNVLYYGAWIVMGISYSASGIHKLQCSSWLDGSALQHVLTSVLSKNGFIVYILLNIVPEIGLKMMTWVSLFAECSFLFLGTFYHLRKWYWLFFTSFHLGILCTINFSDLTWGMMMLQVFTFDASWFEFTRKCVESYDFYQQHHQIVETKNKKVDHHQIKICENRTNQQQQQQDQSIGEWLGIGVTISFFVAFVGMLINNDISSNSIFETIDRLTTITVDMWWGFAVIAGILFSLMILERIFPDQHLPYVSGWWKWVLMINVFQLFAVVLATFTWEKWLQNAYLHSTTGFQLRDHVNPFLGGLIAYLINQWLFYYWHKARHDIYFLWILFHQFHHSAKRIETITSFYKHPIEIIVDSQIMAILLYAVLGLTPDSSIWLSAFSAFGEYFYHMNIKTPKWIGYFFQRPESHRWHHHRNKRLTCPNMSDFPLWDILGNTFKNTEHMNEPTGFDNDAEERRWEMICFQDVLQKMPQKMTWKKFKNLIVKTFSYLLVIWGTLNSLGFLVHTDAMRGVGFVSVSSPLPLVFSSYNGVETFATTFDMHVEMKNGDVIDKRMDSELYSMLKGPYNRRNIYGVMFSHGPFFDDQRMITMRDQVLRYGICEPGVVAKEFGLSQITKFNVIVLSKTEHSSGHHWLMNVTC